MPKLAKQKGLSLIELMIAMGLGLFLVAVALTLFVGISTTGSATDGLAATQENGRFSLTLLSRDLRLAGYRNPENGAANDPFYSLACDWADPCTAEGGGTNSDRVAIWYDPPADDDSEVDCTGADLDADTYIANVYFIQDGNLMCHGWNSVTEDWVADDPVPLIQGVDNMQVLYGISNGNRIEQYVEADAVTNWLDVASVRMGFLVNNGQGIASEHDDDADYSVLGVDLNFTDKVVRKVYTTTVAVNNAPQHLQ